MNTQHILNRIEQMESDLTEIYKISDATQVVKIIEVMEKYNRHPAIINYMKWSLGAIISLVVVGIMGLFLAFQVYARVCL
jgi:hypothetical protein